MKKKPMLSICIPSYNRASFLRTALDSIFAAIDDNSKDYVEICVSDNHSTDSTKQLLKRYQKKSPIPFHYKILKKNFGSDENFLSAVAMAQGEYAWLLSSDDALTKNSLQVLLPLLTSERPDIVIGSRLDCDRSLQVRGINYQSPDLSRPYVEYSDLAKTLHHTCRLMGYISVTIFKKAKWDANPPTRYARKSKYVHVYILLKILRKGGRLLHCNAAIVKYRGENDSIVAPLGDQGRLDVTEKFTALVKSVFPEKRLQHAALHQFIITYAYFFLRKKVRGYPWRNYFLVGKRQFSGHAAFIYCQLVNLLPRWTLRMIEQIREAHLKRQQQRFRDS
ncbi:MAG: glycosyltransferase family 2 protein [DPANN group archaeon]|nr:glycosyltransferase family 2 protein [DPANN group archaeon]